ncbi:MAG: hypothetical protein ACQETV_03765 [Actinomycetota bacterium]
MELEALGAGDEPAVRRVPWATWADVVEGLEQRLRAWRPDVVHLAAPDVGGIAELVEEEQAA